MPFLGRPLLNYTIDAALGAGRFDRVVVSTDDDEIAEAARERGVAVPFLRADHADDHAPVSAATIAALRQARAHFGERYDTVAQLMPNCPLRGAALTARAMDHFAAVDAAFLISAFRFGWMNPWWAATLDPDGRPTSLFGEARRRRSQDLPPLFCPSGAIWIADADALEAAGSFYGEGHIFWEIDWESAVDIDDEADLRFAETVARRHRETGRAP